MNKQTDFVLKKVVSLYMFLKIQSAKSTIQCHTNCTNCTQQQVSDMRFPGLCLETARGAQQWSSGGGSTTFRLPWDLPGKEFQLCPAKGNVFDGDMKGKKNRNEIKLDHTAFWRFRLKTAWHGKAIRKEETLWPQCQLSCYTTKHIPSAPPPLPSLPPVFFSHLFLIKNCLP